MLPPFQLTLGVHPLVSSCNEYETTQGKPTHRSLLHTSIGHVSRNECIYVKSHFR